MMPHLFFWFGRNRLFFEQDLHKSNRVILLEYEKFVHNLANMMQWIYEFCDRPYAENGLIDKVGTGPVFNGKDVDLPPKVDELCSAILVRLQPTSNSGGNKFLYDKSSRQQLIGVQHRPSEHSYLLTRLM